MLFAVVSIVLFAACNKGTYDIDGVPPVSPNTVSPLRTLGDTLALQANDSLYYAIVVKGGGLATLNNRNANFTAFVPTNAAVRQFVTAITAGAVPATAPDAAFKAFINSASFPASSAAGIVNFNIIPQTVPSTAIPTTFPNLPYPTLINPAPTVSPFVRLLTFPSNRNGFFVNNIPMIGLDKFAANGVYHEVAAVPVPPSQFVWDRINTDANLTYFKAAIRRADSGTAVIEPAMKNIGANLTVYAPVDAAVQAALTAVITQALIAQNVPPATAAAQAAALASSPTVFSNPALYPFLTAERVKGIVVYHLMTVRAFNNNLPTTQTNYPTLLNSAIAAHPGIGLRATFTGPMVTAATVKGLGNATPANVQINPTPNTGTSDQFYLNGVLHKIDQLLLPQ